MTTRIEVTYRVWNTPEELSRAMAQHLVERAEEAAIARGVARIAVSGGHTPKQTFEVLADPNQPFLKRMPWDKLQLFWVDERTVPPDNSDSNYRMTREAMLDKVPLKPEQVHRIEGELDPEEAADRYEATLRRQFRLEGAEVPTFDHISLGMGDDGHTASLFPHTAALHEFGRLVVANQVPQKNTWRVTLTLPVIKQARDVVFLVDGAGKAEILKEVLLGNYDPETHPSQLILPDSGKLTFFLDAAAAALLPKPEAKGAGVLEIER